MSVLKKQSGEPMLEFRLAYLRAIAQAWADPAFEAKLLDRADIQPLLAKQFGLTTIWPKLDIHLENSSNPSEQTLWKPELTGGWIGMDDRFEIVLPNRPQSGATEALAAFYQIFPDLLGPVYDVEHAPKDVDDNVDDLEPVVKASLPTSLGIPGGGPDSLLAFGGVVLRAIALAWTDANFKEALLNPPGGDATSVLSQWLGYNCPFNFVIQFNANTNLNWDGVQWQLHNPDGSLIKNRIVLNYPNAPKDAPLRPIALTSYNNTGPAYPFTC